MLKRFLPRGEFSGNVLTLFTGTLLAQAIPVLVSPLLTRLYSPEDFGQLALFTSIVFSLATFATGRYELAVMLPEKDEDAVQVAGAGALITIIVSLLLVLPAVFLNTEICNALGSPELEYWLYFIPLAVLLTALYQVCSYWLLRKKAFKASAVNKVSQTSVTAAAGLAYGKFAFPGGLVIADIAGRVAGLGISIVQLVRSGFSFSKISKEGVQKLAAHYKDYPLYNSGPAFLNTLTLQLPVVMVSMFYGTAITGFFNFSRQIAGNSLLLISTSVSQVFFEKIVSKKNAGEKITPLLNQLIRRLSLAAIVYVIATALLAPVVFGFVFGAEWRVAGEYAAIMSFGFAVKFIVSPLSVVFPALDAIKKASWWQILYFCVLALLFMAGSFSVYNFLVAFTLAEVLVYSIYLVLILREARFFDSKLPLNNV